MNQLSPAVVVGTELLRTSRALERADLVRYAGASLDFNPIHYSDRVAGEVGLPGVIAHGMLTMGVAGAALSDWLGDPGDLLSYGVRFTRPVPVPDPGQARIDVVATVGGLEGVQRGGVDGAVAGEEETALARVDLTVTVDGAKVLGKAQARVRLH